mgnify:CR=1 FL=1
MDQNIGTMITQILPLLLLITVILFITIMPQRKREKQVKEMKKGDWVRTIGGVVGRVYAVKGENVVLETGPDKVKVTFTKGAIATVGDAEVEADGLAESDIKMATKDGKKEK